jgi:Tol biopolymer transport system component
MNIKFKHFVLFLLVLVLLLYSCKITESEYEPIEKLMQEIHFIGLYENTDTLLTLGSYPQFSYDSQKIIYVSHNSSDQIKREIMIMDIDGQNQKAIVDLYQYLEDVFCSPTRSQLVFSAQDFTNQTQDLYMVNEDGTDLINLTNSIDQYEYQPAFSPDGNFISYIQIDRLTGYYYLKLMDLNGNHQTLKFTDKNRLRYPRFTLNGSKIIYSEESNSASGSKDVRMIDVENNKIDELLEDIFPTLLITFQGRLVFSDGYHIKGYDLVTNEGVDIRTGIPLALSSDGIKIIFEENRMNTNYMLMMNYDGSSVDTLVVDKHKYNIYNYSYYPTFSKDKSKIVYTKEYRYYE